jgi:hypothetical protein
MQGKPQIGYKRPDLTALIDTRQVVE